MKENPMFDKQEVFNFVAEKIIQQGRPSFDPIKGICRYRYYDKKTKTMCKCAIGHLIPDDEYKKEFDYGYYTFFKLSKVITKLIFISISDFTAEKFFLSDLQDCHDMAARSNGNNFVDNFKNYMRRVASKYSLDTSILDMNGETVNV